MPNLADLINQYPELAKVRAQLSAADRRIEELEEENARLKSELAAAGKAAPPVSDAPQFLEGAGVLWKKTKAGAYETTAYCPTCKSPLADYSGSQLCLKCNWQAPLKSFEVPRVYHELFGPDTRP